jgi:CDP-diacylglycerol--glycerol-3-phosphate 3-phosphatidyltransferase
MNKSKWRHVPNILTILRLIAVPVMALLIISEKWTESLIIFILAELTDILDGYIARKYNFITNFGKLADPFADKAILNGPDRHQALGFFLHGSATGQVQLSPGYSHISQITFLLC